MNINYSKFFHVDKYGKYIILSQLEDNLKSFLDWCFLNIGAYTNINRTSSLSISNSPIYKLKPSQDPSNTNGRVWEGSKKDWVWESGIVFNSGAPIDISGVYINNAFYPAPSGSGNMGYKINYPLGRVTFNKPIPNSSNVELNFSFRNIQIYKSNEAMWFKEIQKYSYDPKKINNIQDLTSVNRVQMPSIILELLPRAVLKPYEIGSTSSIIYQDLMLNILTESYSERSMITDILLQQKDRPIMLYDINKVVNSGVYPINYDGSKNINGKIYPEIINNSEYQLRVVYVKNADIIDFVNYGQKIFFASIRYTFEILP